LTALHRRRDAKSRTGKEERMSLWLLILIIVVVVLALGGFGYSRY
jgi:flagellar basal body-associated protein FliL